MVTARVYPCFDSNILCLWHGCCYQVFVNFYYYFNIYLICSCYVFIAACRLSLVAVSRVYSLLKCKEASHAVVLLSCGAQAPECGLSSCSTLARGVMHEGLVAPRHVGAFQTRDGICVFCLGRQIHWTTGPLRMARMQDRTMNV